MRTPALIPTLLLIAALAAPGAVPASECAPRVRGAWVRLPPASMPMLAGFARIENPCPVPVTIVGVRSPSFADVSLHETRLVNGVSRMRAVPDLRIAPDGAATLKPGGLHLMLMQPTGPLKPGSRVVVEFLLSKGGPLRAEFEARRPAP